LLSGIHNPTTLLHREPGLEIIRIKPPHGLCAMLLEPGTAVLARKFECSIAALLSKPKSVVVELVDRLSWLRARSDDATSAFRIGSLPFAPP